MNTHNNSIDDIIGWVPNKIIGPNVALTFRESLASLKNNESKKIFDDYLECVSADISILQCDETVFGLTNKGQSEISSFALFIRDGNIFLKKREAAEKAKRKITFLESSVWYRVQA